MPRNDGYTLGEIAEQAGVSERTMRYGYERNLFVPPPFAGPGARYLREHRLQILSIQKLREQGLKLPEIKQRGRADPAADGPADRESLRRRGPRTAPAPGLQPHVAGSPRISRSGRTLVTLGSSAPWRSPARSVLTDVRLEYLPRTPALLTGAPARAPAAGRSGR
ncbi:helix-turn-helix domain-containing protein [Sorangium sp. So ce590]|uniref:helix-turn-helix domain-containing protein n=1 Tax=Sorangium sp. So ce590 TaxID=3133317 RepID=UPI003F60724E